MLKPLVLALVCGQPVVASLPSGPSYAIVADAGSTGTRVYLFALELQVGTKVQITDLGKGPALSSFTSSPAKAHEAVSMQLGKAKALIPEVAQPAVKVSVFATAGMRLVAKEEQEAIYSGLRKGLLEGNFPFAADEFEARTITGREEGVFALIAANYLAKTLTASLDTSTEALMGVLDLGGSSTQVAAPPRVETGEALVPKLGNEHTFVRSFLSLGMERMRQRTFQSLVDRAPAAVREYKAVTNPCSFYGFVEEGAAWRGTGDAKACEEAIMAVVAEEKARCKAAMGSTECLDFVPQDPRKPASWFLISGYMYVTDFARWWLEKPRVRKDSVRVLSEPGAFETPTIAELREVATVVCGTFWDVLSNEALHPKRKHRFTGPHKIPHRCFELNYIIVLLSSGYGFDENARTFRIVEDIDGGEIEWTLGAFLHGLSHLNHSSRGQEL